MRTLQKEVRDASTQGAQGQEGHTGGGTLSEVTVCGGGVCMGRSSQRALAGVRCGR